MRNTQGPLYHGTLLPPADVSSWISRCNAYWRVCRAQAPRGGRQSCPRCPAGRDPQQSRDLLQCPYSESVRKPCSKQGRRQGVPVYCQTVTRSFVNRRSFSWNAAAALCVHSPAQHVVSANTTRAHRSSPSGSGSLSGNHDMFPIQRVRQKAMPALASSGTRTCIPARSGIRVARRIRFRKMPAEAGTAAAVDQRTGLHMRSHAAAWQSRSKCRPGARVIGSLSLNGCMSSAQVPCLLSSLPLTPWLRCWARTRLT